MSQQTAPPETQDLGRRRGLVLQGRSLREQVARGAIVNAIFLIAVSSLQFVRGFLLAIFLTRQEYGVWGFLAVTLGTLMVLKQVGVGDKYIQQDDDDDQEGAFQRAFTMEAAFTGVAMVGLALLLGAIALATGEHVILAPGAVLLALLPALALQMPIWAFYRRMDFVRQRLLLAVDPVVGFVVSVALAAAGAGYWAIVVGLVAGAWSGAAAAIASSPYRLRFRWDASTLRSYARFSWPLFASALAVLVLAQGSILITQGYLGLAAVGAVTLAATILQFTQRVDEAVTGALYPAIAAVRERTALLRESFVKSNRLALIWAAPFGIAITLFSDDLIQFVIGERWRPALPLLQVFGVAAAIGHIGFNWDAYFRAVGRTRPIAVASVATCAVFLASAIPLTAAYGLKGMAIANGAQAVVHVAFRAHYLSRLFHGFAFLLHAARALAPCVPAAAAVLLIRLAESGDRSAAMAGGELVLYVAIVAAATVLFERSLLREALAYVRRRPVPA